MTTTQISTKDNRTPIYYIGLLREGRKLIIQAKESVDELSCEITDYLGPRRVRKSTIEANKTILLAGFKADPKYRNCDMVEVQEPEPKYKAVTPNFPPKPTKPNKFKQIAYLERMQKKLTIVYHAIYDLSKAWEADGENGFDMNEYLADKYPFVQSCDDLTLEVDLWYRNAWTALNKRIKVLQGYPVEKVYGTEPKIEEAGVEEPPAPYYTPEEAEGKWVCAFDTICEGWQCVRYSEGDKEDYPVLYDSKEAVETDEFFDGDDDFAILATEFIEERRAMWGKGGLHITGTPIVKSYKIMGNMTTKAEEPEMQWNKVVKLAKQWQSDDYFPTDVEVIELELDNNVRLRLLEAQEKCNLYGYNHIAVRAWSNATYLNSEGEESDFRTDVEEYKVFKDAIYFYAQSKYDSGCQIESEMFTIKENLCIEMPDHAEIETNQQ